MHAMRKVLTKNCLQSGSPSKVFEAFVCSPGNELFMVGGRGKVPNIKGEPRIHALAQSHQGSTCGAVQCVPSSAGTLCSLWDLKTFSNMVTYLRFKVLLFSLLGVKFSGFVVANAPFLDRLQN